jgi:hypothetical protein
LLNGSGARAGAAGGRLNLGGRHRLGFYCIAVSHAKGFVSLPLCGDSPGCSSNERADTDAQSNLSAASK